MKVLKISTTEKNLRNLDKPYETLKVTKNIFTYLHKFSNESKKGQIDY